MFYLSVPNRFIADFNYYSNLRLGDIIEHDCTPGYRQSGVTVQWRTPAPDNSLIMNPLIIYVNQSLHSVTYTCVIAITNHDDTSTCPLQLATEITIISVKGNVNLIVDLLFIHLIDTFVKTVMTNVNSLILSNTPQQLECHITTNTDINTANTDINSIVNVSWYRDNGNENRIVSNSTGVSILPTVSISNVSFNSTLIFSSVTSSTTLGNYTCVAQIGEQPFGSKTSNNVAVMIKSKCTKEYHS